MAEPTEKKPSGMTVSVESSTGPASQTFDGQSGSVTSEGADDLAKSVNLVTSKHDRENPAEPPKTPEEKPAPAPEESKPTEALGDYDGSNPETIAKFDQTYFKDGKLNFEQLTKEFDGNAKDGKPGALSEATYKYLEDRLGVPRAEAERIQKALVAERQGSTTAFLADVGGQAGWDAMTAWGSGGGYTAEQRERFNAAISKGGQDAVDARDALFARYSRANPGAKGAAPAVPAGRPKVTPTRDATAGASGAQGAASSASGEGFASQAEMDKAFRAAVDLPTRGERDRAMAAYTAKKAKTNLGRK